MLFFLFLPPFVQIVLVWVGWGGVGVGVNTLKPALVYSQLQEAEAGVSSVKLSVWDNYDQLSIKKTKKSRKVATSPISTKHMG